MDYLRTLGGVARTGTLLKAGYTNRDVAVLAKTGYRPARGIVAITGCDQDYLFALTRNGLLTCGSAAQFHGLWIREAPPRRHLAVNHARTAGFVGHRGTRFPSHDMLPIASVEDTLLHALGCLEPYDSVAMVESAVRAGRVRLEMLAELVGANRLGPARRALLLVKRIGDSQPEVEARLLFEAQGWTVLCQAEIPGVGRVDFLIEGVVIVEIDGHEFHGRRPAFVNDRRRMNEALLRGYPTLRYPPETVWRDPQRIVRDVEAMLVAWRLGHRMG
ncbi:type IV toxin-antitoxin system AbiEi family antitoxin domain-containing protein [Sinomonas halotolerans]